MSLTTKQKLALACNSYIVVSVVYGFIRKIIEYGVWNLVYYTQDSNLFAAIVSAVYVFLLVRQAAGRGAAPVESNRILRLMRYLVTCCLTITFCVSLFVLSPYPQSGGLIGMFFTPVRFTMHLTTPVLSFVSLVCFEASEQTPVITRQHVFLSLVPSLVYAAFLYPLNAFEIVYGPYPFLLVSEMPVLNSVLWFIGLVIAFLLIAQLVRFFANKSISRALG